MTKEWGRNKNTRIPAYALISAAVFLCCLIVLVLLVVYPERLSRFGLIQSFEYVARVLMGLAAAAFLFGVLRSSATYEGNLLGGRLKLVGPVVVFFVVVFGSYYVIPNPSTFSVTAYVHGESGPSDVVLRNSGTVILELGPDARSESIGDKGQAYFPAIPSNFRGQEVQAWVESDSYVSVDPNSKQALNGPVLYLKVKKRIIEYQLSGTIFDEAGNPLAGVRVVLPEFQKENQTNQGGRFEFRVATERQQAVGLIAEKNGYQTAHLSPTLGDGNLSFTLTRSR